MAYEFAGRGAPTFASISARVAHDPALTVGQPETDHPVTVVADYALGPAEQRRMRADSARRHPVR